MAQNDQEKETTLNEGVQDEAERAAHAARQESNTVEVPQPGDLVSTVDDDDAVPADAGREGAAGDFDPAAVGVTPEETAPEESAHTASTPGWFYTFIPNKVGMGATINLPPLYLTEVLNGTVASVGVASALTSAATVPAAWLWGKLSDRYGSRKTYLILGFLGFSIPTLLIAFTTEVWHYMLLVALLGAWSVAGTPVSSTLIMDTVPRGDWDVTFGKFNAINGWGVVAGRLLGLVLIGWGVASLGNEQTQRGLWLLSGGLSLLSVLWAIFVLPRPRVPKPRPPHVVGPTVVAETRERQPVQSVLSRMRIAPGAMLRIGQIRPIYFIRESVPHAARRINIETRFLLRDPLILYYIASFMLFTVSVMAYTPFAVWQRQELGNFAVTVFLVGMMNSLASALTFRLMGRLIKKYGSIKIQMWTIFSRVITFAGFALVGWLQLRGVPSVIALLLLNLLSGLGWAGIAVAGNTTVAHLAQRGSEGAAVGAYTSFVSIGSIIGALVSGYLVLLFGYEWVFMGGAVGILVTLVLLRQVRKAAPAGSHV